MMAFVWILLASLAGTHSTYWLIHRKGLDPVRASAASTLAFVGLSVLVLSPLLVPLQASFFGGTFVAMSEPHRLSEKKVLLAGAVFAVIFYILKVIDFVHFHGGMGGTIGGTAFVACLLVYGLQLGVERCNVAFGHRSGRGSCFFGAVKREK